MTDATQIADTDAASAPPGGLTESSPGQTDRVAEIVAIEKVTVAEIADGTTLPELAGLANRHHAEFQQHARSAIEAAWHCGQVLIAAKAQCKHGEWLPWLDANFHGARRTAQDYMQLAANTREPAHLGQSIEGTLRAIRDANRPEPDDRERIAAQIENDDATAAEAAKALSRRAERRSQERAAAAASADARNRAAASKAGGRVPEPGEKDEYTPLDAMADALESTADAEDAINALVAMVETFVTDSAPLITVLEDHGSIPHGYEPAFDASLASLSNVLWQLNMLSPHSQE